MNALAHLGMGDDGDNRVVRRDLHPDVEQRLVVFSDERSQFRCAVTGSYGDADDQCATANECAVTVTARDSTGEATATPAAVTIMITDVDEKPVFTETAGTALSPKMIMSPENRDALFGTDDPVTTVDGVTYMATDPEGLNVNLTLMGADAGKFSLSDAGVLSFMDAPDREMPGDANGDNMYELTVRADEGTMTADRMVKVTVTNVDEAPVIEMVPGANVAPMFASDTADRWVEESTARGMNIGAPVMARDANGEDLTYSLSGTNRSSFRINSGTGQLTTYAALDYETKMSYMVTVTATDPDGLSDSIDVTIMVTDVEDETGQPGSGTLLDLFDDDDSGEIEKNEVIDAINDYLDGGTDAPTKADVIAVINLYLDS